MKKKNFIVFFISVFILMLLGWYLFIKESDYCVSFEVKTATGTVFQGINEWASIQSKRHKENYTVVEKKDFDFIKQEMKKGNSKFEYVWDMESINDSITKVSVRIKEPNHSFYNRLTAPFWKTKFKTQQIEKIKNFKAGLENHIKNFKIEIDGEGSSEETFVAYISLKSVLQEKSQNIIGDDPSLTAFLFENHIKIMGRPYVEIVKWDLDKETLDFNYCFPVDKNAKIVGNSFVKFKKIAALKGLKATYFGDYRTSDRAWFALLDYAKKNGYKIRNAPLEHLLTNPYDGEDKRKWKTEIIIPFDK